MNKIGLLNTISVPFLLIIIAVILNCVLCYFLCNAWVKIIDLRTRLAFKNQQHYETTKAELEATQRKLDSGYISEV